jgi:hypothetical protein
VTEGENMTMIWLLAAAAFLVVVAGVAQLLT